MAYIRHRLETEIGFTYPTLFSNNADQEHTQEPGLANRMVTSASAPVLPTTNSRPRQAWSTFSKMKKNVSKALDNRKLSTVATRIENKKGNIFKNVSYSIFPIILVNFFLLKLPKIDFEIKLSKSDCYILSPPINHKYYFD